VPGDMRLILVGCIQGNGALSQADEMGELALKPFLGCNV